MHLNRIIFKIKFDKSMTAPAFRLLLIQLNLTPNQMNKLLDKLTKTGSNFFRFGDAGGESPSSLLGVGGRALAGTTLLAILEAVVTFSSSSNDGTFSILLTGGISSF